MNDAQKLVGVPVEEPLGPEENIEETREKLSPSLSSSTEVRDNSCLLLINIDSRFLQEDKRKKLFKGFLL